MSRPRRFTAPRFDVDAARADFPALAQTVNERPLVYLDSAATALKPQSVIDAVVAVYSRDCANVHRGVHTLSQRATQAYEGAREKVRAFVNASSVDEIVFVRGASEAINLVAATWGRDNLGEGDEILVSGLEHHSNIVPWQLLCERTGARLVVVPIGDRGEVTIDAVEAKLSSRTRLVAMAHVSNSLGTVLPVRDIVRAAHARGARVLLDGAQGVVHGAVDLQALGCDFYAFSGHKLYGPTGIGVLYGRRDLLAAMPPWQGGGDMIETVTFERTTFAEPPAKFEAGTPNIAGAIGLGAAVDYLSALGMERVDAHEREVLEHGARRLAELPGVTLVGTADDKVGVLAFTVEGAHPHDVGTLLDEQGVAIRTGHHCTQPVMARLGVAATCRASIGLYTTREDLDRLVEALAVARGILG